MDLNTADSVVMIVILSVVEVAGTYDRSCRTMSDINTLQKRVRDLVREKNAVFLAHNYQPEEIQEIADLTGDSLGLSIEASGTDAEVVLFCGVTFMAESAAILSPQKRVLLPRRDAGCPMADMITAEQLREAKAEHRGFAVVTYVNSSAEVKAESDICCTSANAVTVVNSLPVEKIFFTPDRNLAHWTSLHTDKQVLWWNGFCPTHDQLTVEEVIAAKKSHPDAVLMAHPECRPEVLELADAVRSTSGMLAYAKQSDKKKYLVATEKGHLYPLRRQNPDKEFILVSESLFCPDMKKITLEDIIAALEDPEPFTVTVPEPIRVRAKTALDRMLAVPRDAG